MSWSSGSKLFVKLAQHIRDIVSDDYEKRDLYHEMILEFMNMDCDNLTEWLAIDPILDEVLHKYVDIEEIDNDDEDDWPDGGREMF